MDERVMQFRVGVMVLTALMVTAILLVLFGKLPTLIPGRRYPIQIRFNYAGGVTEGTPVRKSGVLIGRVTDVRLVDGDQKVLVTASIDGDKKLYANEECVITRDLLGDTALAFIPDRRKPGRGKPIPPGAVLEGRVADDPTGLKEALADPIGTVTETGRALTAASKKLEAAAERVEEILDENARQNIHTILQDTAESLKTIRSMLGDEQNRSKLTEAVQRLPETLDNMNRTFRATEDTLRKFTETRGPDNKTAIERMVETIEITERTLRKFSESPEPGEPAPADQIAKAMENIGEITTLMRSIMTRIEQGDGSLGALLNDRELYNRLNRAARNVERLTCELQPILRDARVFTDKVSRHPGVILRDAVKPGVGIK